MRRYAVTTKQEADLVLPALKEYDWPFQVSLGCSTMQGWRAYMEDTVHLYCKHYLATGILICSVFDGHGGAGTSTHCKTNFNEHLFSCIAKQPDHKVSKELLRSTFLSFDKTLSKEHTNFGCTASVLVLDARRKRIFLAHVGDSRALVFTGQQKILHSTADHNPDQPIERARLEKHGMNLTQDRVVVGTVGLNLSRSFGDFNFKGTPGSFTADPDIYELDLKPLLSHASQRSGGVPPVCVFLASDGVWNGALGPAKWSQVRQSAETKADRFNSQVVKFLVSRVKPMKAGATGRVTTGDTYSSAVSTLFDRVSATFRPFCDKSSDNLSAILVSFSLPPNPPTTPSKPVSAKPSLPASTPIGPALPPVSAASTASATASTTGSSDSSSLAVSGPGTARRLSQTNKSPSHAPSNSQLKSSATPTAPDNSPSTKDPKPSKTLPKSTKQVLGTTPSKAPEVKAEKKDKKKKKKAKKAKKTKKTKKTHNDPETNVSPVGVRKRKRQATVKKAKETQKRTKVRKTKKHKKSQRATR